MSNADAHRRGDVLSYNEKPFGDWDVTKYNVNKNPGKRLSAYQRFQQLIMNQAMNIVVPRFVEQGVIQLNENGKWKDKMKLGAQVAASAWFAFIIKEVASRRNLKIDSKQFRKFKNSEQGKQIIDNTVTELFYHLTQTHTKVGWTEEKRNDLENRFLMFVSDELYKLILHQSQLSNDQHIIPNYQAQNVKPFNEEVEGEFGNDW